MSTPANARQGGSRRETRLSASRTMPYNPPAAGSSRRAVASGNGLRAEDS
jgi:hypothetical protein